MAAAEVSFPTVGRIAEQFDVSVHQVLHVIRTRRIEPVGRAGVAHVYSDPAVKRIGDELRGIAERRALRTPSPAA
ncbi:MAG: hypothetical protein WBD40_09185 [Tepidisphaeraceae bacterium]